MMIWQYSMKNQAALEWLYSIDSSAPVNLIKFIGNMYVLMLNTELQAEANPIIYDPINKLVSCYPLP